MESSRTLDAAVSFPIVLALIAGCAPSPRTTTTSVAPTASTVPTATIEAKPTVVPDSGVEIAKEEDLSGRTATPFEGKLAAELETFIEKARIQAKIPGVAVAVVQNGKIVWSKGFGERTLGKGGP